ncbi:MAG: dockerin type I domain-containing protein [Ruminococcus flavefaciens]|nr:dockerin type I domain-containing protein [Ruminococcus flavefaciens]MCM1231054.1 dockerin type I domain-containing protein [Ruminococcus flavefaciens]
MKKTISAIIASMLTVSALPIISTSAIDLPVFVIEDSHVFCDTDGDNVYETEIKKGDINGDGKIDASDASKILEIYSSMSTSAVYQSDEAINILADLNGDGKVDASDATYVLNIYAGNSVLGSDNSISVSTEILGKQITIGDVEIPAGATAITVNVSKNTGFSLFDFIVDMGAGYDVITDSENRPVFSKCKTVNYNSIIETAVNGDTVVINGLFGYDCLTEGGIITFYANENADSTDKDIAVESGRLYSSAKWREYGSGSAYLTAGCPLLLNGEVIERSPIENSSIYTVGDINGDMKIDLTDAFDAFYAVYSASNGGFNQLKDTYMFYFPNITDLRAAFLWNEYSDSDMDMTAFTTRISTEILKYCADISSGKSHTTDSYITEIRHIG